MTDKQTLLAYRWKQAEETLNDAQKMLQSNLSPRSIINRAYYSMFYAVLALFLHHSINPKTSKHTVIIGIFDKEFIHTGKLEKYYSKILHKNFEQRQRSDYKELLELTQEHAKESVKIAREFLETIKSLIAE